MLNRILLLGACYLLGLGAYSLGGERMGSDWKAVALWGALAYLIIQLPILWFAQRRATQTAHRPLLLWVFLSALTGIVPAAAIAWVWSNDRTLGELSRALVSPVGRSFIVLFATAGAGFALGASWLQNRSELR